MKERKRENGKNQLFLLLAASILFDTVQISFICINFNGLIQCKFSICVDVVFTVMRKSKETNGESRLSIVKLFSISRNTIDRRKKGKKYVEKFEFSRSQTKFLSRFWALLPALLDHRPLSTHDEAELIQC